MQKNHIGKILAVGIIVLFIGVGIHPAFAVDTHTSTESLTMDNDLIELPVQIHTSKGIQRHTLELTNQQVDELDKIFDKLKVDLWDCNSHYEVSEVYKEAIVSLSENGLLPDGLSVDEAQELVLKNTFSTRFEKIFSHLLNYLLQTYIFNLFCSISGNSTNTRIRKYYYMNYFKTMGITYGSQSRTASGWVHTSGLLFTQKHEGPFYGRIASTLISLGWGGRTWIYYGAVGFKGIIYSYYPAFSYIGRTTWVWVGNKRF